MAGDTQAMGLRDMYVKRLQKKWEEKSPEERAAVEAKTAQRYDANMARVAAATELVDAEWERSRAEHQARLDAEVLGGPAGAHFWGTVPDTVRPSEAPRNPPSIKDELKNSLRDLKDTAAGLADPKALLGIGSEFGPDLDPEQRRDVVDGERAAREAARRPYLAPVRTTPVLTRVATRGNAQFEDLANHLAQSGLAARPDLVFGVYRVPDRLDPKMPGTEAGRVVEWDIVHVGAHAPSALAPAAPPRRDRFDGEARWVGRRKGDPAVLDEDLALAWMAGAGIQPGQCLGIAREIVMQGADSWFGGGELSGDSADVYARVQGVSVIHTVGAAPPPTGPIEVPFDGVAGTHVEVLNWSAVAMAVHPRPQRLPEAPSPFPYLPSTPQEVLVAYLEIVGVRPEDCFGAAVTIDRFFECREILNIREEQISLAHLKLTDATKLPCADGTYRRRLHAGTRVVITYRDGPAYVQGRQRWLDYQRDVLFARLQHKTGARRPITDAYDDLGAVGGALRRIERFDNAVERIASLRSNDPAYIRFRDQARYCMPLG
jgi:hypothetical protein